MNDSDLRHQRQMDLCNSGADHLPPNLSTKISITETIPFGLATPCWAWMGAHDTRGYARMRSGGRVDYVRRVVLRCEGVALGRRQHVIGLCGDPGCVNPAHHLVGTKEEARAFGKFGHLAATDFVVARMCLATGEATKAMLTRTLGVSETLLTEVIDRCTCPSMAPPEEDNSPDNRRVL